MTLKVYFDFLSQPSRALILFLRVNRIPHQECKLNLLQGEHFSETYEQINPFRKVPAIVDGSFNLTESIGILRYLCRERDVPDHWYPKDSQMQAKVDEYLEWQHLNTRMGCAAYFLAMWRPMISGNDPNTGRVEFSKKQMIQTLDTVENIWLNKKKFLIGDTITIADLFGACEIEQTRMVGFDPCEGHPNIASWLQRLQQELHPHYNEVHKIINEMAQQYKNTMSAKL